MSTTPTPAEQIASLQDQPLYKVCHESDIYPQWAIMDNKGNRVSYHYTRECADMMCAELTRLRSQQQSAGGEWAEAAKLAVLFHDTYERLAPSFGYETRPDTKAFDPTSKNGRLMVATCQEVLRHAPHAPAIDEQKVREVGRRFVENLLLPHSVDANEEHEHKVDRLTEQLMDALRPLLGSHEEAKP